MKRLGLRADVLSIGGDYTRWDYFEEAGAAAARRLLQRQGLPTAVVAPNDHTAVGLLQIILRSGVGIPADVSVTGFDDAPIARLPSVDLTTVRQDPELMGVAAVDAAVRRVEGRDLPPQESVVDTSLVVRGSTAAPRARPRRSRRTA
jgi:DNA-binding LacI/PurR family transcriptional regulator